MKGKSKNYGLSRCHASIMPASVSETGIELTILMAASSGRVSNYYPDFCNLLDFLDSSSFYGKLFLKRFEANGNYRFPPTLKTPSSHSRCDPQE
ncbi:MAG: hypothetical protein J2P21_16885, partial [Chloracidobacterium sp.]|nr:hypothetical protein [Chloracidobacterium sp.]